MSQLWGAKHVAQRFGGKYSPIAAAAQAALKAQGKASGKLSATPLPTTAISSVPPPPVRRIRLMFILPFFFLIGGYFGTPEELIFGLSAFAALLTSAIFTREGLRAEAAFNARAIARRPALPRKALGAILMAAGLFLGAKIGQTDTLVAAVLGGLGMVLHVMAFGWDPWRNKASTGVDAFQSDRVARYVDEAEATLTAMREAIAPLRDRALQSRVDAFATVARDLFRGVESDPSDLTAARKYLTVYMVGARDATVKFAAHYAQTRDANARAAYEALLTDLQTTFASRSQALIGNSQTDLNIEIDVLRDRLKYNA